MAKGTVTVDVDARGARRMFWRGVLERLVWFMAGVIVAVLCRMGAGGLDAPEPVSVVAEVRCDCNWHLMADSAAVYELTVPSETMNDLAKGLREVADEMKRARKSKR